MNPTHKTAKIDRKDQDLRPLAEGELDDAQLEAVIGGRFWNQVGLIVLEQVLEPVVEEAMEPWSAITPYLR